MSKIKIVTFLLLILAGIGIFKEIRASHYIEVSPTSIDFGNVDINTSTTKNIRVVNRSDFTINVSMDLTGTKEDGQSIFSIPTEDKSFSLGPNSGNDNIKSVSVVFNPVNQKEYSASTSNLTIRAFRDFDEIETISNIDLRGTGVEPPVRTNSLTITPTSLDFEGVGIGKSKTLSININNNGSPGTKIEYTLDNVLDFKGTPDQSPTKINVPDTATVNIEFKPTSEGAKTGRIDVYDVTKAKKAIGSVSLQGNGHEPEEKTEDIISVDPTEHAFKSEDSEQTFTIKNLDPRKTKQIHYSLTGDVDFIGLGSIGAPTNGNTTLNPKGETNDTLNLTVVFRPDPDEPKAYKQAVLKINDSEGNPLFDDIKTTGGDNNAPPDDNTPPSDGNINGGSISITFPCPLGSAEDCTITNVVKNIINGIFGLLGAIAVGMIVYGGVIYMVSGASKDGAEKGKKIITSAVIGLVIILLSLAIIDLLFVLLEGR